jgi:uncharacterized protein with HEPN domain
MRSEMPLVIRWLNDMLCNIDLALRFVGELDRASFVYRHDYEEVDADEAWVTVLDHLPPLRVVVEHELELLGPAT